MDFKDYYAILGVDRTAGSDEIKKAFRKLARKFHPDVSKEADADSRMKEINEAYAVLGDPEKRAAYDGIAALPHGAGGFQPPPEWQGGSGTEPGIDDPSDFFNSLFGRTAQARHGGRNGKAQRRGQDLHASITIELADAYTGASHPLRLRSSHIDEHGQLVAGQRTLDVSIPKGVRDGQHMRLAGQGGAGYGGGSAGDLYLEVHIARQANLTVDGRDVYQTARVTPWEVALGGAIDVNMPAGKIQVTVPPASQGGRKLRLKGRGIPAMSAQEVAGDLYLVLEVYVPPAANEQQRKLYDSLAREMAFNPRAETGT